MALYELRVSVKLTITEGKGAKIILQLCQAILRGYGLKQINTVSKDTGSPSSSQLEPLYPLEQ